MTTRRGATARSGRLRVQAPRAFVFQNPDHQVIMPTVGSDVAFGLGHRHDLSEEEVERRVRRALEAVNLGGDDMVQRQVSTLSGGAAASLATSVVPTSREAPAQCRNQNLEKLSRRCRLLILPSASAINNATTTIASYPPT